MFAEAAEVESQEQPKPRDQRALNAYRHGLTGQVLVIPPAEKLAYETHCQSIHESFAPKGGMETELVQSIADDRWRLKRAAAMENNIIATGLTEPDQIIAHHEEIDTALAMARIWMEQGKGLQLLTLYEGRLQRKVEKNLAILHQMQQERRAALQQLVEEIDLLSQLAASKGESFDPEIDLPRELLPPQFDFSSGLVARLAARHRLLAEARTRFSKGAFTLSARQSKPAAADTCANGTFQRPLRTA
jgi:hypothetical protein